MVHCFIPRNFARDFAPCTSISLLDISNISNERKDWLTLLMSSCLIGKNVGDGALDLLPSPFGLFSSDVASPMLMLPNNCLKAISPISHDDSLSLLNSTSDVRIFHKYFNIVVVHLSCHACI